MSRPQRLTSLNLLSNFGTTFDGEVVRELFGFHVLIVEKGREPGR